MQKQKLKPDDLRRLPTPKLKELLNQLNAQNVLTQAFRKQHSLPSAELGLPGNLRHNIARIKTILTERGVPA